MCGITGIYRFDDQPVAAAVILRMVDAVGHRGPDGRGSFQQGPVSLGHCRLKIIDLSDDANQPMADEAGNVVVYNGEIYNYLELKDELHAAGHRFKTASDTEVLLAAYRHWGTRCLRRFNGMFAFALWDSRRRQLFCARDRFGVKPLYLHRNKDRLAFASEITPLLTLPDVARRPHFESICDYLCHGLVDHTSATFFEGIEKLPAGCFLLVGPAGAATHRYWDFAVSDRMEIDDDFGRQTAEFRRLLSSAVSLRLRSDVPVGSCLSGGIDSAAIVCLIDSILNRAGGAPEDGRQRIYSAVFDDKAIDERPYIRAVAERTDLAPTFIRPSPDGFCRELDRLIRHQEEPFTSSSIYAQWCVFKAVRETGVTVVLDGQGADEQLCGYRKFSYFFIRELIRRRSWKSACLQAGHFLKAIRYFQGIDVRHSLRYFRFAGPDRFFRGRLLKPQMAEALEASAPMGDAGSLSDRIKADITRFSLPSLLRYEDKNAMAFGVESRTPYLDYRLVSYLAGLPIEAKINRGWTKYVMRRAVAGVVPEKIRLRVDKLAFDTPQDRWLAGRLKTDVLEAFRTDGLLPEIVDMDCLLGAFRAYLSPGRSYLPGHLFFRAFMLQRWARVFF